MNLRNRYEKKTGICPVYLDDFGDIHVDINYVNHLETQLTWRPVSDPPKESGLYFVRMDGQSMRGVETMVDVEMYTVGEGFYKFVTHWLPVPPIEEES